MIDDYEHETRVWFDDEHRDRAIHFNWNVDPELVETLVPFPPYKTRKGRNTMAAIISDAIMSAKRYPNFRTSYSRNNSWYLEKARYYGRDLALTIVPECVDRLVDVGILIDHDRRPQTAYATGIQSSFLPSPHLAEIVMRGVKKKRGETIQLKNDEGTLIDYRDTNRTHQERKFLAKINRVISESEIELRSPNAVHSEGLIRFDNHSVVEDAIELYRVYNGGCWTLGGRFYGGYWQGVSKAERKCFYIDGQAVHEEDYSQIHPSMLYALAGVQKEGDAYDIPGWNNIDGGRDLCKKAFNVLVNANCWSQAHGAIKNTMGGDHKGAKELIEDIKKRHPIIHQKKLFHSGLGLKLQSFDSTMCRKVLDEMTIKNKITCLPVHDSFIVQSQHKELLAHAMKKAWDDVMATIH